MPIKHRVTLAKELVDQSSSYFGKQRENLTATQPKTQSEESERNSVKSFEPTSSFSKVFTETVGKKTRPSININLKENPRLINLSEKNTQQNKENETEQTTQMRAQELEPQPPKNLEPTANFHKVFSEIVGKKPRRE